jgi:hypothetical protein
MLLVCLRFLQNKNNNLKTMASFVCTQDLKELHPFLENIFTSNDMACPQDEPNLSSEGLPARNTTMGQHSQEDLAQLLLSKSFFELQEPQANNNESVSISFSDESGLKSQEEPSNLEISHIIWSSRDWVMENLLSNQPSAPQKKRGKTDWSSTYSNALSPEVPSKPLSPAVQTIKTKIQNPPAKKNNESKRRSRRPRKLIPDFKEYADSYTDDDVLFGRGGRANHHSGNKEYRAMVEETQQRYRNCEKNEKTRVAQSLVDSIKERGGRFLDLDKVVDRWYIVPNTEARRKVGQALRDNNTPAARAARRARYGS